MMLMLTKFSNAKNQDMRMLTKYSNAKYQDMLMLTKYQNTRVPGYTYVDRVPQVRDTAEAAMATVSM